MATPADLLFARLAVLNRFVTQDRVDEGFRLMDGATALGLPMTLPEVLVKRQYLTPDQAEAVVRLRDYLQVRKEDVQLGQVAVAARRVSEAQLADCLSLQESVFKRKKPYPRLAEILLERRLIDGEGLQKLHLEQERLRAVLAARERATAPPAEAAATPPSGASPSPAPGRAAARKAPAKPPARAARKEVSALVPVPFAELPPGLEPEVKVTGFSALLRAVRLTAASPGIAPKTVIVLDADGALDGYTFPFFEQYLQEILEAGFAHLVINCRRLSYLSSAGIGVLIGFAKEVRERHGDLRLVEVQDRLTQVIELVGSEVLRLYDAENAAIASFRYL